jgi:hypothetical protein
MTSISRFRLCGSSPSRCRGNALVFSMLGLVIGGIVLALGITYFQSSQSSAQVQATVGEVGAIIGSAQQNYGPYGYNGLTTVVAVGSRVIPEARADAGGKSATDAYSGALNLVDNSGTIPDTAKLSYANVPAAQCSQIVNATQALAREVLVAAVDVKPLDGSLDIGKTVSQCTSASNVAIDFVIGRT